MTERAADKDGRIESDTTSFWRGTYDEDPELRRSFLQAVTRPR